MTITKACLTDSIHNRLGLSRNKSAQLLESLLEIIKKTLGKGGYVIISGFGKFSVYENNKRSARNRQAGKVLFLVEKRIVTFKCSPVFESKINGNRIY